MWAYICWDDYYSLSSLILVILDCIWLQDKLIMGDIIIKIFQEKLWPIFFLLDAASRPIGCQSKVQGYCCIRQRNIYKKLLSALSSNKSCHKIMKLLYSLALTHLFIVGFEIIHNSSQGNLSRADLLLNKCKRWCIAQQAICSTTNEVGSRRQCVPAQLCVGGEKVTHPNHSISNNRRQKNLLRPSHVVCLEGFPALQRSTAGVPLPPLCFSQWVLLCVRDGVVLVHGSPAP